MPIQSITWRIILLIGLSVISITANALEITNYQPIYLLGYDRQQQLQLAIRRYQQGNETYLLTVNPNNFQSSVIQQTAFTPTTRITLLETLPFIKALNRYTAPSYPLQNAGLTHAATLTQGNFLTIDLCPSKKPFEKAFFQALIVSQQQPIPITIAITGLWIEQHPQEFAWLIQQKNRKKLAITWVNHSYHHPYDLKAPLDKNFLLTPGTNFQEEVLATEKLLLSHGQIPAIFFRFPGLVADKQLILELKKLSLIPLGSDAWLAKDEKPRPGSIILVHGNSNEPKGIELIMPLLREHALNFLPLQKAL